MRKRTIGILYTLAVLLNLWGLSTLATIRAFVYWNNYNYIPFTFFQALPVSSIQIIIIIAIVTALLAAMVLGISAWVAVLIQYAKTQRWDFFLLTCFFGGIMLIIYLFTDETGCLPIIPVCFNRQVPQNRSILRRPGRPPASRKVSRFRFEDEVLLGEHFFLFSFLTESGNI